jgi:ureidoglycolate dehydrogenase (NAD+)
MSTRLASDVVLRVMREQLVALGAAGADHVAASLVSTSLRGTDSHGIGLFPHYVRAVTAGRVAKAPRIEPVQESGATCVLDADHAFGHLSGSVAIAKACDLAESVGMGAVAVRNSTHFGAAAYFALQACERGYLGFAFTNADALVRAWGGRARGLGTNPICVTAPLEREEPLCLDMATSAISWNKVLGARRRGEPLPPNVASDSSGEPTTDANAAAMVEPVGTYKGYGLGLVVEMLCGVLSDGPIGHELLPMFTSPIEARRKISHFFMALDPARFVPADRFRTRLQALVDSLRGLGSAEHPVLVPGDPEKAIYLERARDGIPIDQPKLDELLAVTPDFQAAIL